jgi:hypothetical protein
MIKHSTAKDIIKVESNTWLIFAQEGWYLWDRTQGDNLKRIAASSNVESLLFKLLYLLSPTLMGIKPATTITITNRGEDKCLNLGTWRRHRAEIMAHIHPLKDLTLLSRNRNELVMFYNAPVIERLLAKREVYEFYKRLNYPLDSIEVFLKHLRERCESRGSLPAESGVILGIPLTDVKSYMGLTTEKKSLTKAWNMYGDPSRSLKIYNMHREAQQTTLKLLRRMPVPRVINELKTMGGVA